MKDNKTKKKKKRSFAFTLIELLAVIIILGILMIIAVPAVTKYINDSRKSSYINSAKGIISGTSTLANSEELDMTDPDTTYYIPAKYVKTEKSMKTPYGEFTEAYVGVVTDGKSYDYYWVSNDTSNQGIKIVTNREKLDIDLIEGNLLDSDIRTTVETTGIEDRLNIRILNLDGTWQEEREATKNLNEDGEIEPTDTLQAIFVTGEEFNSKIKNLAGHTNSVYNTVDTDILYIKRSKAEPSDENKQSNNLISTQDSEVPIYAWFDNGTIYWWSEDIKPNLNSNAKRMFAYFQGVKEIEMKYIKTNLTTNMQSLFAYCCNLETIDVSKFDTSNVTNMQSMFNMNINLDAKLKAIKGIEKLDTSKVTTMRSMFCGLTKIKKLDVSHFDTSNVTDMKGMFQSMKLLEQLDVSKFNTSNVTNMNQMFYDLESLEQLDVSNFDTSKVTNMSYMFGCGKSSLNCQLPSIIGLNYFDTSKVTDMSYMFVNQHGLRILDLSNFDTGKVKNMTGMFMATNLTTIYASSLFDASGVSSSSNMFSKSYGGYAGSNDYVLTGGAGTTYDSSHVDKEYARIDDPANNRPGYFTLKTN